MRALRAKNARQDGRARCAGRGGVEIERASA
jgi:hypothetical protein